MATAVEPTTYYAVTALDAGEDPVSPGLVGIYSTPARAVQAARACFAQLETDEMDSFELFGREDATEAFLKDPTKTRRVLLNVLLEDQYDMRTSCIVAINPLALNQVVESSVPLLLRNSYPIKTIDGAPALQVAGNKQLHVLVLGQGAMDLSGDSDVCLIGVFDSHDAAMTATKFAVQNLDKLADSVDHNDNTDNIDGSVRLRGVLFENDEDSGGACCIAMDTTTLDKEFANDLEELELGLMGWKNPEVNCDIEEPDICCTSCKQEKAVSEFFYEERSRAATDKNCKACVMIMSKECNGCKSVKTFEEFQSNADWYQADTGRCKSCFFKANYAKCSSCPQPKLRTKVKCSACKRKKRRAKFSARQYDLPETERKCHHCVKMETQKPASNKRAAVTPSSGPKKKLKTNNAMLQCSFCNEEKERACFSNNQRKNKFEGKRKCKACQSTPNK